MRRRGEVELEKLSRNDIVNNDDGMLALRIQHDGEDTQRLYPVASPSPVKRQGQPTTTTPADEMSWIGIFLYLTRTRFVEGFSRLDRCLEYQYAIPIALYG
jgi:hypothetical protein